MHIRLTAEGLADFPPILQLEGGVNERSVQTMPKQKFQLLTAEPNPVDEEVRISVRHIDTVASTCKILLTDAKGTVIMTHIFAKGEHQITWNTAHLGTGMYFARLIVDDNHRDELKIVIQR